MCLLELNVRDQVTDLAMCSLVLVLSAAGVGGNVLLQAAVLK